MRLVVVVVVEKYIKKKLNAPDPKVYKLFELKTTDITDNFAIFLLAGDSKRGELA